MKQIALALVILASTAAFAAKDYQVTGPVLEVNDAKIVVQKGSEKWEIERTPGTKITGDLKVGSKVTVHYTMSASDIEAKDAAPAKKKK